MVGLANDVPNLLSNARAPSTNLVYGRAFQKWKEWAACYSEVRDIPAEPTHVVLYLTHLAKSAKSFATVNVAICALAWAHALAGLESPSKNVLVLEVLQGIKRGLAKPTVHREPFAPEHVKAFFDVLNKKSLTDLRNTVIIVIAYYGFFRFEEVSSITLDQVSFHSTHVEIFIPKSKADQLRQGNTVVIAKLGGVYCPVELLEQYINTICPEHAICSSNQYLFRRVFTTKGVARLADENNSVSYNVVRQIIKQKATQIGLNNKAFGTHSMRAGGASAAANSSVGDRILQKHGRWASVSSRDRYVKDSLENRLQVTKNM